jgi:isoleucyl-tRNA synthetase
MDYQKTVQLPKTEFPMRGNLPRREPMIQRQWDSQDYYGQLRNQRKDQPKFILHDGPPYANGHIHLGTAVNKVLKDIVIRSRSMSGYDCPYVPGWDVHGLPIEHALVRSLQVQYSAPQICCPYLFIGSHFLCRSREDNPPSFHHIGSISY